MTRKLDEYECIRADVAQAFFDYVNIFNLLESNVTLCISSPERKAGSTTILSQLSGLTMHRKMEMLNDRIAEGCFVARDGLREAFDKWFEFAIQSKAARNRYIHGRWDIAPGFEKPVRFTPNQWSSTDPQSHTEHMTMNEFLELMGEMNRVFEGFNKLRTKYGI